MRAGGTDWACSQAFGRGNATILIKDAMEIARQSGGFTIFALVDALTKLSQKARYPKFVSWSPIPAIWKVFPA